MEKQKFSQIYDKVKMSVNDVLNHIKDNYESNYVLFLANGHFLSQTENIGNINPYVIDYMGNFMRDETRLKFITTFLNTFYSFEGKDKIEYDEIRMNLEMMCYTHIWEAKHFLKLLFRLSYLVNGEDYKWQVDIPAYKKHEFIAQISKRFEDTNFVIGNIIKSNFHASLRNAFAHSDYSMDEHQSEIKLQNYGGKEWEIPKISFEDWSEKFVYSFLLSYHVLDVMGKHRLDVINNLGKNTFTIQCPNQYTHTKENKGIKYHSKNNRFCWF